MIMYVHRCIYVYIYIYIYIYRRSMSRATPPATSSMYVHMFIYSSV